MVCTVQLLLLLQLPWIVYSEVKTITNSTSTMTLCYQQFPSPEFSRTFFVGVMFFTCYCIPLCFMSIFYFLIGFKLWHRNVTGLRGSQAEKNMQRRKVRIVRMLVTVATVFALFWLPLYVIKLHMIFGPPLRSRDPSTVRVIYYILTPIFQWLGSTTSAINPFIYCYFSIQFRKYMFDLLGIKCASKQATAENSNDTEQKTKYTRVNADRTAC